MPSKEHDDVLTMPLPELRKRAAKAKELLDQANALLPGLVALTDDERRHSSGRFRRGEAEALVPVLDVAEKHPALVASLAAKDGGTDPETFETAMLRDALERAAILQGLADEAASVSDGIADTVTHLGDRTRPVLLAAYALIKPHAAHDDRLRSALARTLDFFGGIARQAAATRRKNKAQAEG